MPDKNFTYSSKRGGIFSPKFKIVPYPGPIMRRQAIRDTLKKIQGKASNNKYIEIGYGSGIFAYEFYKMGYDVYGYEQSENAYNTAQELFNSDKQRFQLKKELTAEDNEAYDILGAYEVLEHIEDDGGALKDWGKLLSKNGHLIISVPARMKNFGLRDKWAGHIRRYEKKALSRLLEESGFEVIHLISYGFPLPKLIDWLIKLLIDKPHVKRMNNATEEHKTNVSGIDRQEEFKFNKILPYRMLVLSSKIQRWFYKSDLGTGYLVLARKA